jgi:tetratricopeptide (TPR) repeat protein
MVTKAKTKSKATKKAGRRASATAKSLRLKRKAPKATPANIARNGSKPRSRESVRQPSKMEARRSSVVVPATSSRSTSPERTRSKHFENAIHAYEAGIKFMHAEEFEKAIRCFEDLIAEHPEEQEIQERAKILISASEKKIQEKDRAVLRSTEDYYNVGIAELNRRELDAAIQHLQHALKLMPSGDHILYALATANALQGNREQALQFLKQSISHRGENRFLAIRDTDFESLQDDSEFRRLVTPSEK